MADEEQIPDQQAPPPGEGDLQKLYGVLHEKGLYSKTFDEFKTKYSTPENVDKLFSVVADPQYGLYSKTKDDFYGKYFPGVKPTSQQVGSSTDYRTIPREKFRQETSPVAQISNKVGADISQDPASVARRQHYDDFRKQAVSEVETPDWKDKIFKGKVPSLTTDPSMPVEAFQTVDPKGIEEYLDSKPDLTTKDRYWLRNQIINYGKQRHDQYYIEQRANKLLQENPTMDQGIAFGHAAHALQAHQTEAIANRLNNIGLDDKPIKSNAAFHDQITGTNKALMGAVNYAGDLGQQVSSLLELGNVPGLSQLGYKLKTDADNLKARNEIPQTGDAGNLLAGEILPMALDMESLRRLSGAVGKPLYQALGKARAAGRLGEFAEGAIGGLAVSPANSYIIAHQYYNDLVKQGVDPASAAAKSDQLLVKNMATDLLMTPVQMGLLKMGAGNWVKKALLIPAEGIVSGTHFTLQDFNQKSTENPALTMVDYLKNDPDVGKTFISGAALGMLQKAAVDQMHKWDVKSETNDMFSFGRKYGRDDRNTLPSNPTIARNVLSAIEMKDTPGRVGELKDLADAMHESGVYNENEAKVVKGVIDDVAAVRAQVPKFGRPEQRMAVMNELLSQRAMEPYIENAGHPAAGKNVEEMKKESDERIQRIMGGQEPLYFINGNETNRTQLLDAIEKNPELLTSKGVKIKVINDSETTNKLKDALQKQKSTTNDVRSAPGDSQEVGGRDEGQGAIDQKAAGESVKPVAEETGQYLESRHADTDHDEQKIVSGQNNESLSAKGRTDAEGLADEVHADHDVKKVISSDLPRAAETAKIVANKSDATHEARPELRSWDLGEFSGMPESEFKRAQEFFVKNPDVKEFEGKKVTESFNEYKDRVIEAQEDLQKEGPDTMVINHSNNMSIWDAFKKNGAWNEQAARDYLETKAPEPATLRDRPAEKEVVEEAARPEGDHNLLNVLKTAIDETNRKLHAIREGDQPETGSDQAHGETGQQPKETGIQEGIPKPGEEQAKEQDRSGEPVSGDRSPPDEARVTEEAAMQDKYTKSFIKEDVIPAIKAVGATIKDAFDILRRTFDPRHGVDEKALTHITEALGERNKYETVLDGALHSFEKMFNKMKDSDRVAFVDRMKRGMPQGDPVLDEIAKMLRYIDKGLYEKIVQYKPSMPWKEDHFRVLWKVIPGADKQLPGQGGTPPKTREWDARTRRPLEGSKGFMKRASLTDMTEGIARGGVPQSTNPITMFKLAYADGMKFITAQRMFESLKGDGFAKFVRQGKDAPAGFKRLDDRLARVYFRVPEGTIQTGEYWIDPGAARLLNNYLSIDKIRATLTGRSLMNVKNFFTAAELSVSGFHAVAEGMEAISSQVGVGLRKMFNLGMAKGDLSMFGSGVKDILTSPYAAKSTASLGANVIRFTKSEDFRNSKFGKDFLKRFPDANRFVDDFFHGGGIMKQHEDLKVKWNSMWKEQSGKDNYIGATIRAVPAINEMIMSPLFNVYIPRLKVGMFFKEFPVALQENAARIAKGDVTRQEIARKTINFIDDRLGEMNFDNLFWNKTFKTAMQFALRSVTWKLGNIRAVWGVIPEQAKEISNAVKENRKPIMMPKFGWLLGLAAMQTVFATVIQHMLAHKDIEEPKDLVAPQINPDDPDERVILPTYAKDLLHQYHDPVKYVTSSMAGQLSRVKDIWDNKDFYGYEIYDPHESAGKIASNMLLYVAPKPFSVTSAKAMADKGEPWTKQIMSFMGLVKAPGYLAHTDIENEIFDIYNKRNAGTKPKGEKEANDAKKHIRELMKEGDTDAAHDATDAAIKEGTIRPGQLKTLMKSAGNTSSPSVFFFKRLPFEDKQYLFEKMSDEEKKLYDPKGTLQKELDKIEKAKNE